MRQRWPFSMKLTFLKHGDDFNSINALTHFGVLPVRFGLQG